MFKRAALSLSVSLMMLTSQEAFSALYVEQYSPEPEYVDSTSSAVKGSDSDLVIYNSKKESGAVSGVKVPPKQFVLQLRRMARLMCHLLLHQPPFRLLSHPLQAPNWLMTLPAQ